MADLGSGGGEEEEEEEVEQIVNEDVRMLLRQHGLEKYAEALVEAAGFVSADEVSECTEAELEEFGIKAGIKKGPELRRFKKLVQVHVL